MICSFLVAPAGSRIPTLVPNERTDGLVIKQLSILSLRVKSPLVCNPYHLGHRFVLLLLFLNARVATPIKQARVNRLHVTTKLLLKQLIYTLLLIYLSPPSSVICTAIF
jgi:hypothetical protein